jgi:hypothetical protein
VEVIDSGRNIQVLGKIRTHFLQRNASFAFLPYCARSGARAGPNSAGEFAVEQKFMNRDPDETSEYFRRPPAHPLTGRAIFAKLRAALAGERGAKLTLERLGQILGKATSTAGYWFEISNHPPALGLVCLLERLSAENQQRFVRSVCRPLPTVLHPNVARSPRTVADLLETLKNPCGISLVRGGNEASRSYLLSALGHTFSQLYPRQQTAVGIDLCPPDKFVPVETVRYLRAALSRDQLLLAITELWPQIQRAASPLVLLNGVWSAAPELHPEIVECAKLRNVILADAVLPDLKQLAQQGIRPLQLLTLSPGDPPSRIEVSRQEWKPPGRPAKKCR